MSSHCPPKHAPSILAVNTVTGADAHTRPLMFSPTFTRPPKRRNCCSGLLINQPLHRFVAAPFWQCCCCYCCNRPSGTHIRLAAVASAAIPSLPPPELMTRANHPHAKNNCAPMRFLSLLFLLPVSVFLLTYGWCFQI